MPWWIDGGCCKVNNVLYLSFIPGLLKIRKEDSESEREREDTAERKDDFVDAFFTLHVTYRRGFHNFPSTIGLCLYQKCVSFDEWDVQVRKVIIYSLKILDNFVLILLYRGKWIVNMIRMEVMLTIYFFLGSGIWHHL